MSGGKDLLVGTQLQAAVEEAESHGRAVSESDVGGIDTKIMRGGRRDGRFRLGDICEPILDGVGVESAAVHLDRVTNRFGVRRQEESRHMNQVGREIEIGADGLPTW